MTRIERCADFEDIRTLAKSRLPSILFDYIDGGSYNEITLERNIRELQDVLLHQRIMKDVSRVSSTVKLFGENLSIPLILAPVGFAGMFARRGEVQAAKTAKAANLPFCLSTLSICSIEEVVESTNVAPWFQLYMIKDRKRMIGLLERAKNAGSKVLVLTADLQTPGARYRDHRSGMRRKLSFIEHLKRTFEGIHNAQWTYDVYIKGRPHSFGNLSGVIPNAASFDQAWDWVGSNFDPSVTWKDLDFIRQYWEGPVILKGVMTAEDATLAIDNGVDGIVVSNHGGRQLDSSPSSISVLSEIVEITGNTIPVLFDGGVRSGLDILKALQLGATACLVGRPWAFALGAGGEEGVARLLKIFKDELVTAQILTGTLDTLNTSNRNKAQNNFPSSLADLI